MKDTVLTNLKIWNGTSEALESEHSSVRIRDGQIVELGKVSDAPDSIDMGGAYVIPGLIDAHVHMCLDPQIKDPFAHGKIAKEQLIKQMLERSQSMLAAGITTARDLGGGQWLELEVRDLINQGDVQGCRLICAGQPITSVKGHCHFWGGEAEGVEQALSVLERQDAKGVDLIKVMATGGSITPDSAPKDSQFTAAILKAIVDRATELDYKVAAHCHGTEGIRNAAQAGVTTIEHCSWVGEEGWGKAYDPEVVEEIVANGVWVSPTVNAGWKRYIGTKQFEGMMQENYRKMKQAGVRLIASTDAGIPGVIHHHLPLAVPVFAHFAEMTPIEALRSATSDCAEAIGLGDSVGQIAPGFSADLVFFEDDPTLNLDVLASPVRVMSRGAFFESAND
jgi:imidazolonepropionase-like amidohydrolase